MGLPIIGGGGGGGGPPGGGGGSRRPAAPPTHKPVPMQKLMNLLMELEDVAEGGVLGADAIEDCATEQGVPRAMMYAAAVLSPELRFAKESDVAFVCCAGGCQEWGAVDVIEQLLRLRRSRLDEGKPAFDVHARMCLDRCENAPMVVAISPDGMAAIPAADAAKLAEAVEQLCAP
jgi:NADH:ubiquinone oxidoreductase subunit E